ncbi:MAG: TatD family hydrolase [Nitrospirota bacterium]
MIDSHAHLQFEQYADDLDAVLARAREAGVTAIINIGTDLDSSRAAIALAERHPHLYATVGIHPHDASTLTPAAGAALAGLARHPKVVAIGETGLDFYYGHSPREAQIEAFRLQLRLAQEAGRPVVVHSRDAKEETLRLLSESAPGAKGVLHCFTGDLDMAERAIELGFYISFSGIVTFKNAGPLRDVARALPIDRLLIETDCPFLAPEPHRGKRNEPAWVARVADTLAALRAPAELEQIRTATSRNGEKLFKLPPSF